MLMQQLGPHLALWVNAHSLFKKTAKFPSRPFTEPGMRHRPRGVLRVLRHVVDDHFGVEQHAHLWPGPSKLSAEGQRCSCDTCAMAAPEAPDWPS